MNYIEKLLDGVKVEWKSLGEVAKIQRGSSPRPIAKYITNDVNGVPWIKIGDTSPNSKYVDGTAQKITIDGAKNSRVLQKGALILSNSMSYGRPYILKIDGAIHDGWASISDFEQELRPDYLYHYLSSNNVQYYWESKINSSSVSNLNSDIIKELLIPIPPLHVQEEIVRILDTFTELTTELTARKKQYEYYRDKLLTFDDSVEWKTLGEVADVIDSLHQTPQYTDDGLSMIRVTDIKGGLLNLNDTFKVSNQTFEIFTKKYLPRKNDLVMSRVGSYGNVSIIPADNIACMGQNTVVINPHIYYKYLYFVLTSINTKVFIDKNVDGGSQKTFSLKAIKTIPIPIVSAERQNDIAAILDKFDALTNSITEGLPREIELRKQQYEYYRDMLLTFPKVEK